MAHEITQKQQAAFKAAFLQQPQATTIQRAVMNNGINAVSEDPDVKTKLTNTFSLSLPTGKATDQKHSGRCWLFATLNTLRHEVATKLQLLDFEFSENYLSFWDRFEKANAFYEFVLATAKKPADSRVVTWLFDSPNDDGGQWDNAAALIKKYGLVPKSVMPETQASANTTEFSQVMGLRLRKDGIKLRQLVATNASQEDLARVKKHMLTVIYRLCATAFGTPVEKFDFTYRDKKQQFHRESGLTPQQFAAKYLPHSLTDYVTVINSPDKPFNQLYTIPLETNVVGGQAVTMLNVDLKTMKALTLAQLKAGEPVWFGNDVLTQMDRKQGLLASRLYDYDTLFGADFQLSKKARLQYRQAVVSHAMTLSGVDLKAEQPQKWRVENSWGEKVGTKGYFAMADDWFDDYVYQVVIKRDLLPPALRTALKTTPVQLAPWDSMG